MADFYWYNPTGNANWTSGGASSRWYSATNGGGTHYTTIPTAADNAIFDANSGAGICNFPNAAVGNCLNLYCNGYNLVGPTTTQISGGPNSVLNVYGAIVLSPNQVFDLKQYPKVVMTGVGAGSINCNGNSFGDLDINKTSATVTLNDDLIGIGNATLNLVSGTFNANNKNVTFGAFYTGGTTARTLTMGSGTWTMTFEGEVTSLPINTWEINTTTGLTFNKGTGTIRFIHARNEPTTNNSLTTGLRTALTSSASTIDIVDIALFNTVGGSSGYVLVGDEVIGYSGINTTTRQLTGLTRGYGGTTTLASVPVGTAVIGVMLGNSTLTAPMTAGVAAAISVVDASKFPQSGVLYIGTEQISYSGTNLATNQLGTTSVGTPIQSHSSSDPVYSYQAKNFIGGGLTYNNVVFGCFGYRIYNYIYGSNTYSSLSNSNTGFTWTANSNVYPGFQTLYFNAGGTNTITGPFTFTGTSNYQQFISGPTTLRAPTSQLDGVYSVGANSVNGGGNTGLTFTAGGIVNYIYYSNITFNPLNYDIAVTGLYATAILGNPTLKGFWTPVIDSQTSNWIPVNELGNYLVIEGNYNTIITTESGNSLCSVLETSPNWSQVTDSQTPNWTPVIH